MPPDFFLEHQNHGREYVRERYVIARRAGRRLHGGVINQVAADDREILWIQVIAREVLRNGFERVVVEVGRKNLRSAELLCRDAENAAPRADIEDANIAYARRLHELHIAVQGADAELCGLMRTGAERRARIDLDAGESRALRRHLLPGRLNQNIVDDKGVEEGLPVVNPVLVLGETLRNPRLAEIGEPRQFLESFADAAEHRLFAAARLQIKAHARCPVVRRQFRQNVDEHALGIPLRERRIVLNLDALNAEFRERRAHQIHCLLCGIQRILFPSHGRFSSWL